MTKAVEIARAIVAGDVSPRTGAAQVWVLSSENGRACSADLRGFIAAASAWDEEPEHRDALASDARQAAVDLLASHAHDPT